jgi:hypothetical protein
MKTSWGAVKAVIESSEALYYCHNDADDLSYRISITANGAVYECSILKQPTDTPDLLDFETNFLAGAIVGP